VSYTECENGPLKMTDTTCNYKAHGYACTRQSGHDGYHMGKPVPCDYIWYDDDRTLYRITNASPHPAPEAATVGVTEAELRAIRLVIQDSMLMLHKHHLEDSMIYARLYDINEALNTKLRAF
jgi:hypothetical protein